MFCQNNDQNKKEKKKTQISSFFISDGTNGESEHHLWL